MYEANPATSSTVTIRALRCAAFLRYALAPKHDAIFNTSCECESLNLRDTARRKSRRHDNAAVSHSLAGAWVSLQEPARFANNLGPQAAGSSKTALQASEVAQVGSGEEAMRSWISRRADASVFDGMVASTTRPSPSRANSLPQRPIPLSPCGACP